MSNPTASATHTVDGIWLYPHTNGFPVSGAEAWMLATSPPLSREMSMDEFTVFNREEELSQDGALHLYRGSIDGGLVMSRNGQTAAVWMARLENLIQNQRQYGYVMLVTPTWAPFKVKIFNLSKSVTQAGGKAYLVGFSFRQVT